VTFQTSTRIFRMCHICYFDWKDVVIVSVGPNLVHVSELENFLRLEDNKDLDNRGVKLKNDIDRHGGVVAIVYWYKSDGSYDGEGTACIKCRNGTWFVIGPRALQLLWASGS